MDYSVEKKVITSGIWYTLSNFLMKAIGFLTTPIFTRLMTQAEFGDFSNIQTWMMIMLYITSLNLEGSLARACQDFKDDTDSYSFSMISLSMISTAMWWFTANLFFDKLTLVLSVNRIYLNCMFVYLMFFPAVTLFQGTERCRYRYKWTVASSMSISVGASLLSVLFVLLLPDKLFGRTIGYVLPSLIVGIVIIANYLHKGARIRPKYWKYALPVALPFIPHLLSMYMLSNIDRVMIRHFCGSEAAGLYSLAYTCGMLITILVNSVNSAYSPWLAEKIAKKEYGLIKKVSLPYVMIFSLCALGAVLVTPEILYVLGGPEYMEARYVLPPVAAGCLLQFVYCMYVNIEQYQKKTVGMAFASFAAAAVNLVLNGIFIPIYGYVAAAYTTYVGYAILLIMHMMLVKKLGMSFLYNNLGIAATAFGISLLIFMCSVILDMHLLRYGIMLIYAVIIVCALVKNKELLLRLRKYK